MNARSDNMNQAINLTTLETASRLRIHIVTLANWRVQGCGPSFIKLGRRVLYPLPQIEAYEKSALRSNTAKTQ
jgi:hypothetical protein